MTVNDIHQLHKNLTDQIDRAKDEYYNSGTTTLSDSEYDRLFHQLLDLEAAHPELVTDDSPSVSVGTASYGDKVEHPQKMYSMDDIFQMSDLKNWVTNIIKNNPGVSFTMEEKIDGVALDLVYEDGRLSHAATRGDGTVGDNITQNAKSITGVPLILNTDTPPELLEVRGEVYIARRDFTTINNKFEEINKKPFANPRNMAAGSIRLKDPSQVAARKCVFIAHGIGAYEGSVPLDTQMDMYSFLRECGIPTSHYTTVGLTWEEVETRCNYWPESRTALAYDIDGFVVKVNDRALQEKLGYTARVPRWMVAFKYPPEEVHAHVIAIETSVGKTGRITPYAIMEPVTVSGSTVSKATLHNQYEVERKDIRVGDWVVLRKAGEIIPEIVAPVLSRRLDDSEPYQFPTQCPCCGTLLEQKLDEGRDWYCPNHENCREQIIERVLFMCSRSALNIMGIGEEGIRELVENGLVKSEGDIFTLTPSKLADAPSFVTSTAGGLSLTVTGAKFLKNVEKAKKAPLSALIMALNIPRIGTVSSKKLADEFQSLDEMCDAPVDRLGKIVGAKNTETIHEWAQVSWHRNIITTWKEASVKVENTAPKKVINKNAPTIVITGSFPDMTRTELAAHIEELGGRVVSSVSSKTSAVIAGDKAGSKLTKAEKLGIPILSLDTLDSFIDKNS